MKRFLLLLSVLSATMISLVSCKHDDPVKPGGDEPKVPTSLADVTSIYIYGSATQAGWDLSKAEAFTDNGGGLWSWQGYLSAGAPFRFPLQKDAEWPCLLVDEDGESLIFGESDDDLVVFTVDVSGTYDIIIDGRDIDHPSVSVDLVQVDLNEVEINELYILGEATSTGWALDLMEQFTNDNGVFTWEGPLSAGKRFRFPLQKIPDTWWPCLMLGENGKVLYGIKDEDESNQPVAEDGIYEIVIDTRDRSNMTYTITLKSTELPDPVITELYVLGDAAPGGWALDAAPAFTNNNGIFTWQGKLRATGEFRINTTNQNWFPAIVLDIATGQPVYTVGYDAEKHKMWTVDKEGIYKIVVDLRVFKNLTVTITYVGDEPEPEYPVTELYMLGDATSGGWDINAMEAFTGDKGVFTWKGTLNSAGGFRFLTQKVAGMWFPAIAKEKATGKAVYVESGDVWNTGAYDHFTVAESGVYEIIVNAADLENITCTITPEGGIKELYMLGDATTTGWDINAMEAFTNNAGILTWTGTLNSAGGFRFLTQKVAGMWFPAIAKEKATGKAVYVESGDVWNTGAYDHFTVAENGTYKIEVKGTLENVTCTIVKQ